VRTARLIIAASGKATRVAIEAASAVIVRVPRMAGVAGVLPVILAVAVTYIAGDAGVQACPDVEPGRAMGVGPRIQHMTFLAVGPRTVREMIEAGASVVPLMAACAPGRPRHDLE